MGGSHRGPMRSVRRAKKAFVVYPFHRIVCPESGFQEVREYSPCFLSLLLFLMPALFENELGIEIPPLFERFIFSAAILGEVKRFHTLPGYLDIGLPDMMKDLFVNLGGAVVFSELGFSIRNTGTGRRSPESG